MKTRPCDISLYLESDRGVVFLDLKVTSKTSKTKISFNAVRISFDGYGCCGLEDKQNDLNPTCDNDAKRLAGLQKSWKKNHCHEFTAEEEDFMKKVVMEYSEANKGVIWSDALIQHGLVQPGERQSRPEMPATKEKEKGKDHM